MKQTLKFNAAEGAILRIMGLVGHRDFLLARADASSAGDDGRLDMGLDVVSPDRPVDALKRQLEKLFDVTSVLLPRSNTQISN